MGYKWTNKGTATGYIFTYGNNAYEYDAIQNTLVSVGNSLTLREKDLMFVLKDLDKAEIVNNSFKIYINYYKLK